MSDKKSVLAQGLNGVKWMSMSSITTTIVNFGLTIVLARLLDASDYGAFQAIAVLVGFADMLWSLGVGPAIIRKEKLSKDDIVTGHTINMLLGIAIFGGINIGAPFWCNLFAIDNQNMLRVYSFIFIFNTVMAVPKSLLYREYRYKVLALSSIAGILVHAILGIILAVIGFGPWALIISTLAQYGIQLFWVIPLSKISLEIGINKKSLQHLAYFGGGYTLMQFFNYVAMQGDNFLVNKLLGSKALGYYGKAYNLMGYPANLVGQTIDQVMYPIISKIQDDKERLKRIFCAETCFVGLVCVPISIVGVICGDELVSFLLGEGWAPVVPPMMIMVAGLFFRSAYKLNYTVLKSLGKVYKMAIMQFAYAIMVIVGSFIGQYNGISGIALGVVIAVFFNYIVSLISLTVDLKMKPIDILNNLKGPIVYTLIMYIIGYYVHNIFVNLSYFNDFVMLVAFSIIVFGLYMLIYRLTHKVLVPEQANAYLEKTKRQVLNKIIGRKHRNEGL